jgi:hypothetical protein
MSTVQSALDVVLSAVKTPRMGQLLDKEMLVTTDSTQPTQDVPVASKDAIQEALDRSAERASQASARLQRAINLGEKRAPDELAGFLNAMFGRRKHREQQNER